MDLVKKESSLIKIKFISSLGFFRKTNVYFQACSIKENDRAENQNQNHFDFDFFLTM